MKKIVVWILLILLALLGLFGGWLLLSFPFEFTQRMLRWGNSDVYDYQKFPEQTFAASDTPYEFERALMETAVADQFTQSPLIDSDFETFLTETGTQAFIVIQDDKILYENYFNGATPDSTVTSFSMAKSFTSALIGIAIDEGYIQSVDDPITDYLPELAKRDPAFSQITIHDLLMMSSGIRYEEIPSPHIDDAKTYYYHDLRDLALKQTEIVGKPGEMFLYNNYHPLLLGLILERTTSMSPADYLGQKIWQPMGAAAEGSWSLDERGFAKMESGINGRALDFAKFGQLFLHQGNWNGEQIISEEWVQQSTSMDTTRPDSYYPDWFKEPEPNRFYKYLWWGMEREEVADDYSAIGKYGQYIYVSPHKNLVIVRHGEKYGINSSDWLNLFYNFATEFEGN